MVCFESRGLSIALSNSFLVVTDHSHRAADKATGSSQTIAVDSSHGRMTRDELEKVIAEADIHAEEDRIAKEKIEARNTLEGQARSLRLQVKNDHET